MLRMAPTGIWDFQALRHVPIAFAPDSRCEWSLRGFLVSQGYRAGVVDVAAHVTHKTSCKRRGISRNSLLAHPGPYEVSEPVPSRRDCELELGRG